MMNMMLNKIYKYAFLGMMVCALATMPAHAGQVKKEEAAAPEDVAIDDDPLYPVNHAIYQFNYTFDGLVLKPVTMVYRGVVPGPGQEMVHNAVTNLYLPVVFANSVLQADPNNSLASMWAFFLNSSFGIVGLFDFAGTYGPYYRTTDFGQTLAIYGAGTGPYIVLPIIGPANGRDTVGRLADAFINPFNYISWGFSAGYWGATAIDTRSQNMKLIDDIYATSLDPYSTFRSGYTQHRAADIRRAKRERSKSRHSSGLE